MATPRPPRRAEDGLRRPLVRELLTPGRLAILLGGVAAGWLSLAVTADHVLATRAPAAADRLGLGAATTRAVLAERSVRSLASAKRTPDVGRLATAERLARAALRREPINVPAVRTLGQIAALRGDLPRADRLFAYSERLSRRDLVTQMWLIEAAVRRDDIDGALRHYDRALRTNGRAKGTLYPVLVFATTDPRIARSVGRVLAARPPWGHDFIAAAAQAPETSPDALATMMSLARFRLEVPNERNALTAGLGRLVAAGRFAAAGGIHVRAAGVAPDTLTRDVGFERDPVLPPFDWTFAQEADLSASRESGDQGVRLVLRAAEGRTGEFGRRLMALPPGGYRISARASGAGADPMARAAVIIVCAGADAPTPLATLPLAAGEPASSSAVFRVPSGCAAQWLVIAAPLGLSTRGDGVAVDGLTLRPIG